MTCEHCNQEDVGDKAAHNEAYGIKGDMNKKGVFASDGLRSDREMLCGSCPHNKVGICTKCGCILKIKVRLWSSECPIGKWSKSYVC